jgi:hypothetical protein
MAICPSVIPKWATSCYGGDDLAWEEAKRESWGALYERCARQEPHVARIVGSTDHISRG